ncbi:hypothetical protein FQN54_002676 [Arachnomyces sp. PD_36]|nr:hypothetical protein FQN54_002676 [Arachnomyces sp. PD_36]
MAPIHPQLPLKRSSPSDMDLSEPPAKRQHRLHRLREPITADTTTQDSDIIDQQLQRSIGLALNDAGFDMADPVALDSFQHGVEEYMLNFSSYIRQSMISCRRDQPIPQDFEHALRKTNTRVDSLRPHVKPSPSNTRSPPTLLPTPPPEPTLQANLPFLGPELSAASIETRSAHIPRHFPNFPSTHTYHQTPVFTGREKDPRKIRERATEEGRLGEEALRKLTAAAKDDLPSSGHREKKLWGRKIENMDSMFDRTARLIAGKAAKKAGNPPNDPESKPKKPDLGPIVNYEKVYWRKDPAAESRRTEKKPTASDSRDVKNNRVESWAAKTQHI